MKLNEIHGAYTALFISRDRGAIGFQVEEPDALYTTPNGSFVVTYRSANIIFANPRNYACGAVCLAFVMN